jgi:hypothetical protein
MSFKGQFVRVNVPGRGVIIIHVSRIVEVDYDVHTCYFTDKSGEILEARLYHHTHREIWDAVQMDKPIPPQG